MALEVIKYKCCGKIYAASRLPDDPDWIENSRLPAIEAGDRVIRIEKDTDNIRINFGSCLCSPNEKEHGYDPNQLNLFDTNE